MNKFPKFTLIFLSFMCAVTAAAQNGAVIDRGEAEIGLFEWDGDMVISVYATDIGFWCEGEPSTEPYEYMVVIRPDGSLKIKEGGNVFTRVFYPATPDDFWGPQGDPCPFIMNGPMVAEGISHFTTTDNDFFVTHPNRQSRWGYNLNGTLYDLTGFCPDDMVHHQTVRKFKIRKNCSEDCQVLQVAKGPRLNCDQ